MKRSKTQHPPGYPEEVFIKFPTHILKFLDNHHISGLCHPVSLGIYSKARGHSVLRPQGSPADSVHLILEGCGVVEQEGRRLPIKAPSIVWLEANRQHFYEADQTHPWTIGWVHISGSHSRHFLQPLGESGVPHPIPSNEQPADLLENLLNAASTDFKTNALFPLLIHSALTAWLVRLAELVDRPTMPDSIQARLSVLHQFLRRNLNRQVSVPEMAAVTHWTPGHLNLVFRKAHGDTPASFFMHLKMTRAGELLRQTSEPIASIGQHLGFDDAFYFSRCFRRSFGLSPSEYRQKETT